jgi:outer membrane protein TolC
MRPNPRLILQTEDLRPSNFNLGQDSQSYVYASQVFEARGKRGRRMAVTDQIVERNKAQADSVRRQIVLDVRQAYWEAEAELTIKTALRSGLRVTAHCSALWIRKRETASCSGLWMMAHRAFKSSMATAV